MPPPGRLARRRAALVRRRPVLRDQGSRRRRLRALPTTRRGLDRFGRLPLVVFDLDGTLIDSRRDLADAANALIGGHGGRPLPVDAITGMVGEGAPLLVRRALKAAGLDLDLRVALPQFLELYDERLLVHTRLYDGTREALGALAPEAALAILTNKPQHHTQRNPEGPGVAPFFRWVVGGDTPHRRKPDPRCPHHPRSCAQAGP